MLVTEIFNKFKFANGEGLTLKAGKLALHVRRISMGWGFKSEPEGEHQHEIDLQFSPGEFSVSECDLYQTGKSNSLIVAPALPDKPLVLKNSGMRILPGQTMNFFVKIPLWVQFYFGEQVADKFIVEYPLTSLSHTWFGEPDNGEPAYAMGGFYQKEIGRLEVQPWEAVCPVHISNNSTLLLEVERLIIRVENLALVTQGNQMMTSLLSIEYTGKEQVSAASYRLDKSIHGEGYQQIAPPRNTGNRSSMKINFHFIKNWYQT